MGKAFHSKRRVPTRSTHRQVSGQRLILERRLALICRMESELKKQKRRIMEDKEQLLERPQLELRMCPKCLRFAAMSHTLFDIHKNQIVRIYKCQCGEQFSDG